MFPLYVKVCTNHDCVKQKDDNYLNDQSIFFSPHFFFHPFFSSAKRTTELSQLPKNRSLGMISTVK